MLKSLSDVVFGMECMGCGAPLNGTDPWLCSSCQKQLVGLSKEPCHPAEDVVSLFPMENLTRKLIHSLKYRGIYKMASYMVGYSAAQYGSSASPFSQWARPLFFVPVPLHRARFRERGYNQAEMIARALAVATEGQVCRWLRRKMFRVSQTKLSQQERQLNVAGAFELKITQRIPARGTVVIVDDVYTTGATTGACIDAFGKDFPLDLKVCSLLYDSPISAAMDYVADRRAFWDSRIREDGDNYRLLTTKY